MASPDSEPAADRSAAAQRAERPAIAVRGVVKSFGGITAVDHCSIDVRQGSITGLIGPNGAGKTTLFNIVAGFMRPDGGRIELEGRDVTGMAPHLLFARGLVRTFQIPHEFQRMSVLENLMVVPGRQTGENVLKAWFRWGRVTHEEEALRDKAAEVLEFLELTRVTDELAGNLSGGQKKLLELGRTMIADARVVLLDEPGAGVNRTLLAKLSDNIVRLNEERGMTFCVIEHDMDLIARLCNPVIVLAEGRVIAEGTMDDIRHNEQVLEAYLGGGASAHED